MRVLVGDDGAINRMVTVARLRRLGHEPIEARDGREAVEATAAGGIDLVLMDLRMPVMGGLDAARAIRRLGRPIGAVPIVALTADGTDEPREACRDAGMNGCAVKPLEGAALAEVLADAVWDAASGGGRPGPDALRRASA